MGFPAKSSDGQVQLIPGYWSLLSMSFWVRLLLHETLDMEAGQCRSDMSIQISIETK